MTLSKEALEAANPAVKPAAPSAQPHADLNRLRADAVSLDVPVKVHGSRVLETPRGATPKTEPFEEETSTMIVFPHGGVVRMEIVVAVGQMLVLTNLRTNQDAICRVVKVRAYSNTQAYVEVEFTHRQLGYWGVHFPADDEEAAAPSPAGMASALPPDTQKRPVIAPVSIKVESLPKPTPAPVAPVRPESAFAQIGSHEDIQPSASHAGPMPRVVPTPPQPVPVVRAAAPAAPVAPPHVEAPPPMHAAPIAVVPPPARRAPVREVVEEIPAYDDVEPEAEAPRSSRTFGTLTGGVGKPVSTPAASDFGVRLDSSASAQQAAAPRSNSWMWIAACAFFLVAGLAAGAFYFRSHESSPQSSGQPGASQAAAQSVASTQMPDPNAPPQPITDSGLRPSATVSGSAEPESITPDRPTRSAAPAQQFSPAASRNAPSSDARSAASAPAATNFNAGNSRPVFHPSKSAKGAKDVVAPSVAPAPAVSGAALNDVLTSSNAAPPPPPLVRVRVGGAINPPQVLKTVSPIYPSAARQAGITGNVVLTAEVDKAGNVGSVKVVSGPAALQAPAMAALKQWKYKPGTLDAEPIATSITVTLKFQQQ